MVGRNDFYNKCSIVRYGAVLSDPKKRVRSDSEKLCRPGVECHDRFGVYTKRRDYRYGRETCSLKYRRMVKAIQRASR